MSQLIKILMVLLIQVSSIVSADEITFSSTKVSKNIVLLQGIGGFTGGNIAVLTGEDGVVMIDDSMPTFLNKLNAALKNITHRPIEFLINTHVHGDHIGNNEAFGKAGAHIVAHSKLRKHLLTKGVGRGQNKGPAPKQSLPVITFNQEIDFYLNDEHIHVFHLASAHTNGDAAILFKRANVIHAGDVFFNGMFPFIDLDSGGSLDGYIAAQTRILAMSDSQTKIIPGHGPLASKGDLEESLAMLKNAKAAIAPYVQQGKSENDIVKINPLAKYHKKWHWSFITTEKMTRQIYKSLVSSEHSQPKSKHNHHH